jgi:hypothetical protein
VQYKNEAALVTDIWRSIIGKYPKAYLIKIHGGMYQEAGIPDLLLVVDGLLVGIEAKNPRAGESEVSAVSRTTLRQRIHIRRIIEAGGMSGVATSVDSALHLIQLAKLKQKMMLEGRPIEDFPMPPHWDMLMRADPSSIIPEPPVIYPAPVKGKTQDAR